MAITRHLRRVDYAGCLARSVERALVLATAVARLVRFLDAQLTLIVATDNSEVLHSEIRQKDSARGSEVENTHEDSECLFGKSSLCRKYFSDAFSCRRALARDLFKEVSYLGIAWQASLAT